MRRQHGFTLVELIMVIVILGVIGGMVAVFMRGPIDAYFASGRRAGLTDTADSALRRIGRDLHKALPNSVRTPGGTCVEFIPTKTGGRYRAEGSGKLDFSASVTSFNELGDNNDLVFRPANQKILKDDIIAVYNLGITGADAYTGNNTAVVGALPSVAGTPAETTIAFSAAMQFPLASDSSRFHVIPAGEPVVGYVCTGGQLLRYTKALPYAMPASCPTSGTTTAVLANNVDVGGCSFDYSGSDLQRNALVRMNLQLTDSGETVSLQHEVHVNNTP